MDLKNKNIMITQLRLHDYAGSEIVTLEMAEYFSVMGANVVIVTNAYGAPIKTEFDKLKNVNIFITNSKELDEYLDSNSIDVVWVHHQIIPVKLIVSPGKTKFIFHHMSPYAELEFPNFWRIEAGLADRVLCNSIETMDKIVSDGILKSIQEKIDVFGNPAPDAYIDLNSTNQSLLVKLLVVSNHVPSELHKAINILRDRNIEVTVFGAGADQYSRLKPEIISSHDGVVTIGKTAQYAIQAGVPVYCYDRFGGPGYLNSDNFNTARKYNFSGRGFGQSSAELIAADIQDNYMEAVKFSKDIQEMYKKTFSLSNKIEENLDYIFAHNRIKQSIDSRDISSYITLSSIIKSRIPQSAHQTDVNKKQCTDVIIKKDREIENIKKSWNYRIGRFILFIPKAIIKFVRKIR